MFEISMRSLFQSIRDWWDNAQLLERDISPAAFVGGNLGKIIPRWIFRSWFLDMSYSLRPLKLGKAAFPFSCSFFVIHEDVKTVGLTSCKALLQGTTHRYFQFPQHLCISTASFLHFISYACLSLQVLSLSLGKQLFSTFPATSIFVQL